MTRFALYGAAAATPEAIALVVSADGLAIEVAIVLGGAAMYLGVLLLQITIGLRAIRTRSPLTLPLLRASAAFCAGTSLVLGAAFAAMLTGSTPISLWWSYGLVFPLWTFAPVTGLVTGVVCASMARFAQRAAASAALPSSPAD
jgi:hypothetical protein